MQAPRPASTKTAERTWVNRPNLGRMLHDIDLKCLRHEAFVNNNHPLRGLATVPKSRIRPRR